MLNNSTEAISFNYTIISESEFKLDQVIKSTVVYEVIRLVNGVPVFWNEHCDRLLNSLVTIAPNFKPDKARVEKSLSELIKRNKFSNTNIRLDVFDENVIIYEVKANYPAIQEFELGVNVNTLKTERQNPNEKIFRKDWKKDIENKITEANVFESLLVNNQGFITEGSRSNVFFIRGNTLFSAEESIILPGITRFEVMKTAKSLGISVEYTEIDNAGLLTFDAAFLCGTSIQILPIAKLNDVFFNVDNTLFRNLQKAFNLHFDKEYTKASLKWKK